METTHPSLILVRKVLAQSEVLKAFDDWLDSLIVDAQRPVVEGDYFTESALLMKRESRVKTLNEIRGHFHTLHDDAKGDNFYNVNT